MQKLFIVAWVLAPLALVAWHYSAPGQRQLAADVAGDHTRSADALEKKGDATAAAESYRQAIAALSDGDKAAQQRLRLAWGNAEVESGALLEGQQRLHTLLSELERDKAAPGELVRSTRHALAESGYLAAFVMRCEGAGPDDWMPQAETARQNFRLLAEQDGSDGAEMREAALKNLEATIKLQQMDLSQLLAARPPKKCKGCKNLAKRQKKDRGGQCESDEGNQQRQPQQPQDVRQNIRKSQGVMNQVGGSGS
jgi:hypothetical protein